MLPPFQTLIDAHSHDVRRFLVGFVGPNDADDCFQEAFLAALRAYPRLRDASNLRAWLLRIAYRKGVDAIRDRRRRPDPVPTVPERGVIDGRADDGLWRAVAALPPKQRAAVVHRFVVDLPYRDVAAAIGTSEDAARRNVHEAVKRLREVVER